MRNKKRLQSKIQRALKRAKSQLKIDLGKLELDRPKEILTQITIPSNIEKNYMKYHFPSLFDQKPETKSKSFVPDPEPEPLPLISINSTSSSIDSQCCLKMNSLENPKETRITTRTLGLPAISIEPSIKTKPNLEVEVGPITTATLNNKVSISPQPEKGPYESPVIPKNILLNTFLYNLYRDRESIDRHCQHIVLENTTGEPSSNSNKISSFFWEQLEKEYSRMGWGQPNCKRGRNSSGSGGDHQETEQHQHQHQNHGSVSMNNSPYHHRNYTYTNAGDGEEQDPDTNSYYIKRPRDISPPQNNCNLTRQQQREFNNENYSSNVQGSGVGIGGSGEAPAKNNFDDGQVAGYSHFHSKPLIPCVENWTQNSMEQQVTAEDQLQQQQCEYENSKISASSSEISSSMRAEGVPESSSTSSSSPSKEQHDQGDCRKQQQLVKKTSFCRPRFPAVSLRNKLRPGTGRKKPRKDVYKKIKSIESSSSMATNEEDIDNIEDVEDEETDDSEFDDIKEKDEISDEGSASTDVVPSETIIRQIIAPIRLSYFPNVPPYLNFCLHDEKVDTLPIEISKLLKWRLSTITPVIIRKTIENSGFRLLRKTVDWGGQWGKHMKATVFRTSLKDFQKINHIPGTFQIGRKDRLWRNVNRFMTKFGKDEFGFLPRTFILPHDMKHLKQAWENSDTKNTPWIVKPPAAARGTGIRVVNKWTQIPKKKSVIVQKYIANPLLINERKFDLRLYVLVTSFHPLKIYLYNDGLVRFAPIKYSHDAKRIGDRNMHLTNYSVNKTCDLYTENPDAESCSGHKWTLKTLWRFLQAQNINTDEIWDKMEDIVIKTMICAEENISSASYNLPNRYSGYELFGFDIILDQDLKPWLLEVNISPSLHSSSPLDMAVKGPLVKEVFNIVGYHLPPKLTASQKKIFIQSLDTKLEQDCPVFDKRLYCTGLSKEEKNKHQLFRNKYEDPSTYLEQILTNLTPDDVRQLITSEDEVGQCKQFRRIFPTKTSNSYFPLFESPRYYNMLMDGWVHRYSDNNRRSLGILRLQEYCKTKFHLQTPPSSRSPICENPENNTVQTSEEDLIEKWNNLNSNQNPPAAALTTLDNPPSLGLGQQLQQSTPIKLVGDNIVIVGDSLLKKELFSSPKPKPTCHDEDRLNGNQVPSPQPVVKGLMGF